MKLLSFTLVMLMLLAAVVPAVASAAPASRRCVLMSPNGRMEAVVDLDAGEHLRFTLRFGGVAIVEPSPLGITVDGQDLGQGVTLGPVTRQTIDETFPVNGVHTTGTDRCNALTLEVRHADAPAFLLDLRAYDDGAAYRYRVPGAGERTVGGETSSWTVPAGSVVWYTERKNAWKLKSYAGYCTKAPIEGFEKVSLTPVQCPPLVIVLPGGAGYAALTEAALYNYSGMRLRALGDRRLAADFTEGEAGFKIQGEIVTPWRVTLAGKDLDALVNSDIILALNPPPDPQVFSDTSWIKPGRTVWSWMAEAPKSPEIFEIQMKYVDYAVQTGFEYSLVDEGWPFWSDPWKMMGELCAYAKSKDRGIWVWVRSSDISAPDENYRLLREYLDNCRKAGVVGLKIDFINSEDKAAVAFETAALTEAARRRLLIVFHGCHKPTGEPRRFPNELSREGVRGLELNAMKEGPLTADHDAALPFTRYLAGHGDYTPVMFRPEMMAKTTWAHQLAMAVVLTSPMVVYAEHPKIMMDNPSWNVLKTIPSTWAETRVLPQSRLGELAVMARRQGEVWFLGVVNGGGARSLRLPLEFLGQGSYRAEILTDSPERPDAFKQETRTVAKGDTVEVGLGAGGGCVIRLEPVR